MNVTVTIQHKSEVHTLPGLWSTAELRKLLELTEFEDAASIADEDLFDMTLMVLQDLGHQTAGERVLEAVFGNEMRAGVRQNLVDDLQDQEPWQDFSTVMQQRGIFTSVVLMYQAFTNLYPQPDALLIKFEVTPKCPALEHPENLLRALGAGMSDRDILHRLYEDELKGGAFADAPGLIWHLDVTHGEATTQVEIISARQWLNPLAVGDRFPARPG